MLKNICKTSHQEAIFPVQAPSFASTKIDVIIAAKEERYVRQETYGLKEFKTFTWSTAKCCSLRNALSFVGWDDHC